MWQALKSFKLVALQNTVLRYITNVAVAISHHSTKLQSQGSGSNINQRESYNQNTGLETEANRSNFCFVGNNQ